MLIRLHRRLCFVVDWILPAFSVVKVCLVNSCATVGDAVRMMTTQLNTTGEGKSQVSLYIRTTCFKRNVCVRWLRLSFSLSVSVSPPSCPAGELNSVCVRLYISNALAMTTGCTEERCVSWATAAHNTLIRWSEVFRDFPSCSQREQKHSFS